MSETNEHGTGFHTRRLHIGGHAVDVRGTFAPELPPIVLVHGIGMSTEYFQPFAEVLASTYDVYALDLPGYGSTPKPPRVLSISELGEALAQVVRDLSLDAPILVGHSMGCQIVVDALANHSGLGKGYILLGPTVDPTARSLPGQAWRLFRDMLAEPLTTNLVVFRDYLRMGPIRHLRTVRHMLNDRTEETIPRCTSPGLIVRGEQDPVPSAEWVEQLVRLAPEASLRKIPGGPHALHHHKPHELAAACAPFLEKLTGRGPAPQWAAPSA